jgi:predicted dehydrogenase
MVFTDHDQALANPHVDAINAVTNPSTRHTVAVPSCLIGKHPLVEKPPKMTVRACRAIIDAARRGGGVLATAENLPRDPPDRNARGILNHALLGNS